MHRHVVEKTVPCAGVDLDVVLDAVARQRRVQRSTCACCEVLFREGRHREAEEQALLAATRFRGDHSFRSRALYRAAHSAHLDDRAHVAIPRHVEAARTAVDPLDRRNAIWGQFVANAELDNHAAALKAAAECKLTPGQASRCGGEGYMKPLRNAANA